MNHNFGEGVLKLAVDAGSSPTSQNGNGWGLQVMDYFTPHDEQWLNDQDLDIGSTEAVLLPTSAGAGGTQDAAGCGCRGGVGDNTVVGGFGGRLWLGRGVIQLLV